MFGPMVTFTPIIYDSSFADNTSNHPANSTTRITTHSRRNFCPRNTFFTQFSLRQHFTQISSQAANMSTHPISHPSALAIASSSCALAAKANRFDCQPGVAKPPNVPNVKKALMNVDVDQILKDAEVGDPLPLSGLAIGCAKMRYTGVNKMSKGLKRVFSKCKVFDEDAKGLLILALALTLEQHAAYAAFASEPRIKARYDACIESLGAELKSCEATSTSEHVQEFEKLIGIFAKKALAITTTPFSPDASMEDPAPPTTSCSQPQAQP